MINLKKISEMKARKINFLRLFLVFRILTCEFFLFFPDNLNMKA